MALLIFALAVARVVQGLDRADQLSQVGQQPRCQGELVGRQAAPDHADDLVLDVQFGQLERGEQRRQIEIRIRTPW